MPFPIRRSDRALRTALLLALAAAASSCIDPPREQRYHGEDHRFSWDQDDVQAERMKGIVYEQEPEAQYGGRQDD